MSCRMRRGIKGQWNDTHENIYEMEPLEEEAVFDDLAWVDPLDEEVGD